MKKCINSKKKTSPLSTKEKETKAKAKRTPARKSQSNEDAGFGREYEIGKSKNPMYPPKSNFSTISRSFFKRVERIEKSERGREDPILLRKRGNQNQNFIKNSFWEKHLARPIDFLEENFTNHFKNSLFRYEARKDKYTEQENFLADFPPLPLEIGSGLRARSMGQANLFFPKSGFKQEKTENTKILNPITNNNFNIYNVIETPRVDPRNWNRLPAPKFVSLKSAKLSKNFNQNNTGKFKKVQKKNNPSESPEAKQQARPEDASAKPSPPFCLETQKLELKFKLADKNVSKKKLQFLQSEFFRLLDAFNAKHQSSISVAWKAVDENCAPKPEEKFNLSLLKEEMQLQTPLVASSERFVPSMVNNVKWNSFLRSPSQLRFLTQTQGAISKILSYLENNQKQLIYHQNNIITLINLQVPLCNDKFQSLSKRIKLRVICMLFAKYVNRKSLAGLCEDFMTEMDIADHDQVRRHVFDQESGLGALDASSDAFSNQQIAAFFFQKNQAAKTRISFNTYKAVYFLKKCLIYVLTLMNLVNQFLELKIRGQDLESEANLLGRLVLSANDNDTRSMASQLRVDPALLPLSLEQLVSLFDIRDFAAYLALAHTYIPKKKKHVKVTLQHVQRRYKFEFSIREQVNLLCCKIKRKDELVKFSFKFIRRQMLRQFQEENKYKLDKSDRVRLKNIFYAKFLNNNKSAIRYFESFDLSRKGLKVLSQFTQIKRMMVQFCRSYYIEAMLNEYIYRKSDKILREDLNFKEFLTEVLSRQHKHSVVVQGVMNSLEQFIDFFNI